MIGRGAYRNADPVLPGVKFRPYPKFRLWRGIHSRRRGLTVAWLLAWRGRCVFHLLESRYLWRWEAAR